MHPPDKTVQSYFCDMPFTNCPTTSKICVTSICHVFESTEIEIVPKAANHSCEAQIVVTYIVSVALSTLHIVKYQGVTMPVEPECRSAQSSYVAVYRACKKPQFAQILMFRAF